MVVGFTGTRKGLTPRQRELVTRLLWSWRPVAEFHHGDCIGADADAAEIAGNQGIRIVSHPCTLVGQRAFAPADVTAAPKPPLSRNRDIVDISDRMIAAPSSDHEVQRSGTWATIRYARRTSPWLVVIYPDGQMYATGTRGEEA